MNNAVTRSFVRRSKGTTTYLFTVFDFGAVKRNLLRATSASTTASKTMSAPFALPATTSAG